MVKVPSWKRKAMAKKRMAIPRRNRFALRSRMGRGLRQPVQFFKRSKWTTGQISAPLGSITRFSLEPVLGDVPNFTEFTSLYDQYQIKGVKITLFPKFSQVQGIQTLDSGAPLPGPYPTNFLGVVATVIDYDGNLGSFAMTDLVQYQNLKMTRGNKLHSRYFKPAIAANVFRTSTAATSGYAVEKNRWLDCQYTDISHYGMYGIVDLTNVSPAWVGTGDVIYDVKVDYYLAFKNVR